MVISLDLMPLLEQVPRTQRRKYGRRGQMSKAERAELSRKRNRDHSRATRDRRRRFEEIRLVYYARLEQLRFNEAVAYCTAGKK